MLVDVNKNNLDAIHTIEVPSSTLSEKYRHLPDTRFLQPLMDRGFHISKVESKGELGTRLIRMSHPELKIGNDSIQVVAVNSHDGSKAFNLFMGIFRMVCSNGLIVGDSFTERSPVRHIGDNFYEKVDTRIEELLRETDRLVAKVEEMKNVQLTSDQINDLTRQALQIRFTDDVEKNKRYKVHYGLGQIRREADRENTLWNVFNRLQEGLIRGNFRYRLDNNGNESFRKAKEVINPDDIIKINTKLWDLVDKVSA